MKGKLTALFAAAVLMLSAAACSGSGSDTDSSGIKTSSDDKVVDYSAENYDFGDPSAWTGEKVVSLDLGDCLIDAYPYDDKYDWGQSIIYDEDDGIYKMWWCRNSGYDTIWYAESEDLKHWRNAEKIMTVTENTEWIKLHVGKPAVLKIDGEYKMYFEAPATLNNWKEFDNNVFLATSSDGKRWNVRSKDGEPYPIIRMTDEQMADSWDQSQQAGGSGYGFYGFGQPSVCYKDGKYYLYYTHTLIEGDRMYVATSDDGVNFTAGREVFLRAGSGVKYNDLTGKFMYAYEYTEGRLSKIFYMESSDGYNFTYKNYIEAAANENVLSKGAGFVRGYPDFISDGYGHVKTHTVYAAYMEGKMAESGNDWRQYAHTWDIHIAAFNPAEFAGRTMVLPDGNVYNSVTVTPYREAHTAYEEQLAGIPLINDVPSVDGEKDALYEEAAVLAVTRVVSNDRAVPGDISAKIYAAYNKTYLYFLIEVKDLSVNESDVTYVMIDEKRFAEDPSEICNVTATRSGAEVTDGNSSGIAGVITAVKKTAQGYNVEVKMPWRYKTVQNPLDTIGFDCFVYNDRASTDYKSIVAWNDVHASYDVRNAGELYFK